MIGEDRTGLLSRLGRLVRRRPYVSGVTAAAVVGLGAYLVFGFFALHLLFVDSTVDEADPFAVPATTAATTAPSTTTATSPGSTAGPTTSTTTTTTSPPQPEVVVLATGDFISRAHTTTGTATVITDGDRRVLRLEGFATDNGPDLNVYLATGPPDGSPGEFVDLGDLKGNIGDQNYELTLDADLDRYTTVFIWCVRFSVAFGAAPLA